jgi:pantetheine-phosphate adenylyltransferase
MSSSAHSPHTRNVIALYAGTFDPPHFGHLDIIRRAAAIADRLIVGVAVNPEKKCTLSETVRVALLTELCRALPNVSIATYRGATVHFAQQQHCNILIRGLRDAADLANETAMAQINKENGIDSVFLLSDAAHRHLSSRLVKQVAAAQLPLTTLIPPAVSAALSASLSPQHVKG